MSTTSQRRRRRLAGRNPRYWRASRCGEAATHRVSRRGGLTGGASHETVHDTLAQGVTQSGGYVECSPRRNSPRSGLEECQGEVDVWPESVAGRRAHCE